MLDLLPKAKLYGLAALAVLACAAVAFGVGFQTGSNRATLKAEQARAEQAQKTLTELNRLNDRVREKERAYEASLQEFRLSFERTMAAEKARDARVIADLRAGNQRLRLPVASGACPAQGFGAVPASAGADEAPRAELAPEAAATLWGIVADGDEAIRQLTGLQDYTAKLYKTCQDKQP